MGNSSPDRAARALQEFYAGLRRVFGDRILPIETPVAEAWGRLRAGHWQTGRILPLADGLIAATALVHDLTLWTRNTRDFEGTGRAPVRPLGGLMDFALSEEQVAIRDMARDFGRERIAPHAQEWEAAGTIPREVLREAAGLGFAAMVRARGRWAAPG